MRTSIHTAVLCARLVFSCALVSALPIIPHEEVLRCSILNDHQRGLLALQTVDIWTARASTTDVRVTATQKRALLAAGLECSTFIPDVAALVREERAARTAVGTTDDDASDPTADALFDTFRSHADVLDQISVWASAYPENFTTLGSIGTTSEGRAIPAYRVGDDASRPNSTTRTALWLNGGIHAREWISSATALYITHLLLTDATFAPLLRIFDVYITPLSNPDGYEYSRTTDRMWRKNRQPNAAASAACVGTDLNRNWDDHWGLVGASADPCAETYAGAAAFSAPETKALAEFVRAIPRVVGGIDLHSYGQYVLRPWGWTTDPPPHANYYTRLANGVRDAIRAAEGTTYVAESAADLYPASGATDDWMNGQAEMVGMTFELRDTGTYGFVLPARFIRPVGREAAAGFQYFADFLGKEPRAPQLADVVLHE